MNELNDNELFAMLDDAANSVTPTPDVGRLDAALRGRRRTRPVVYGVTAAAVVALFVGGAAAARSGGDADPAGPAGGIELPAVDPDGSLGEHEFPNIVVTDATTPSTTKPPAPTTIDAWPVTTTTIKPELAPIPTALPEPKDVEDAAPATTEAPKPVSTEAPKPKPEPAPATTKPPAPEATAPPTTAPPTTAPPAPTTTKPPAPTTTNPPVGFSANQTWGSCGEDPPYEELYGTAPAGTQIDVTSPHGSASTTAGADGHWYVKVIFPAPPANETFTINVSSVAGGASFPFIYTA